MTTVLADFHFGVMVADTGATDGDRQWPNAKKVWRSRGYLLAFAGEYEGIAAFLAWWKAGQTGKPPAFANARALAMSRDGLWLYEGSTVPQEIYTGREAIGSGAKAAMAAYEAVGWMDPKQAVRIACKHDARSRGPVRLYKL